MTEALREVKLLPSSDWHVLRDARLAALRDSPEAFLTPYEAESDWPDDRWQTRMSAGSWVVAIDGSEVIGIAGLVVGEPEHEGRHVESIWVAPTHRGHGVLAALLDIVAAVGRALGLAHLRLWVIEDNVVALSAYLREGFRPTGERQPIRPGHRRHEIRMQLAI